jgi:solute carrier family 35 protein
MEITKEHPKDEQKYISLYFFSVSQSLVMCYLYLFASIFLNVLNRIIYQKYNFKLNFTLLLIQQLVSFLFFTMVAPCFASYRQKVGDISFAEFNSKKFHLLFFSGIFSSFIGNQMVNTAMYLVLRKFLTVMNYLFDLFINKKQLPEYFSQSILLIFVGTIFTGYHDLTSAWMGYVWVFINNFLSVIYGQYSENFKKNHHMTNIKLLIYNSFITPPVLLFLIFATGEYSRLMKFELSFGLIFYLLASCLFTIILNASMFLSNEMNSSLFTQLVSNCKVIF